MNKEAPTFWFPVKAYGWGWGLPVTWQGWVVLGVYFLLQYLGIRHIRPERNAQGLLIYLGVITLLLIAIVVIKGERPVRWRWGKE
jgi:asparagine N-glycosylation enzyme membrane subunit Stt3